MRADAEGQKAGGGDSEDGLDFSVIFPLLCAVGQDGKEHDGVGGGGELQVRVGSLA